MLNNRKARLTTLVATGAAAATAVSIAGADAAHAADGNVWDRVAQCESSGNWSINTGNGYYGGLQFSASTWRAYGGQGSAHHASRAEQIRVAQRVLAGQGPGAWPVCSKRAGLTRANGGAVQVSRSSERPAAAPKTERKVVKAERTAAAKVERTRSERRAAVKTERHAASEGRTVVKRRTGSTKAPHPVAAASGRTVTVKAGDTLGKLARAHGLSSWRDLYAANRASVEDPNLIFVGQVLHLPA